MEKRIGSVIVFSSWIYDVQERKQIRIYNISQLPEFDMEKK